MYPEPKPSRSPWVIPVVVGAVIGVIVIGAVIVGIKLSRGQWNSVDAESTSGSTTSTVVVTETTTESPTTTEDTTPPEDTTSEDTTMPEDPAQANQSDQQTSSLPVPPIADTSWYAQFGAFNDYDRAESVRDKHYGSLILPGEMVGSSSRYVVARPTASRGDAEAVCAEFSTGSCVVKPRV